MKGDSTDSAISNIVRCRETRIVFLPTTVTAELPLIKTVSRDYNAIKQFAIEAMSGKGRE